MLGLLHRVNQWFHTHVVVRIRLHQVDNIEAINSIFACVLHPEVVPLGIAASAIVVLQVQIILCVRNLDCLAQITTLKARFKDQRTV